MFNEHKTLAGLISRLQAGAQLAIITDAGTPAISDPGYLLVRECIRNGIDVECLPGATAIIPAAVISGLPLDRFTFEGFLPQKKGRQKHLGSLINEQRTMVFYESPHRLLKALDQMSAVFGADRQCAVVRELTKMHEEVVRGVITSYSIHYTKLYDGVDFFSARHCCKQVCTLRSLIEKIVYFLWLKTKSKSPAACPDLSGA